MPTSQNGWLANDRSVIARYNVPGGAITLRKGDASVVLLHVISQYHSKVEPLKWPGVWGYAERPIRGSSTTLSNHASGTACDLNAPAHWLGEVNTFAPWQVAQIRGILNFLEGTVRWGGDYRGRKDEMHFEIYKSVSAVARVAEKVRNLNGGQGERFGFGTYMKVALGTRWLCQWDAGDDVADVQGYASAKRDGYFGDSTVERVKGYQSANGLKVDGKVGPQTTAHMLGKGERVEVRNIGYDFPFPRDHWFGPPTNREPRCHSGYYSMEDARHVYRIVKALRALGHGITQTSKYHATLEVHVKRFQVARGLVSDGIVGPITWDAIDNRRYVRKSA